MGGVWRITVGRQHRTFYLLALSSRCPQVILVKSSCRCCWLCIVHLVAVLVVWVLMLPLQVLDDVLQQVPLLHLASCRDSQEGKGKESQHGGALGTLKVPRQALLLLSFCSLNTSH